MNTHSRLTPIPRRAAPVLLALVVGALAALALASPAAASKCGDKILADWYDNGRIDQLYPLHCYEEAIDSIPADIRDYADAEEVISRALQAAVGGNLAPGGSDPTPEDGGSGDRGNGSGGGQGGSNDKGDKGGGGGGGPAKPGGEAVGAVDTSGPSSVPIPLLVLGGMSLALLAAGGLGYLSRRRQAAAGANEPDEPDDPTVG